MNGFMESLPFLGICKNAAAMHYNFFFPVKNLFRYLEKTCIMWDKQKRTNNFDALTVNSLVDASSAIVL